MSKLQNIPSDPKDSWDAAQSLGKGTKQFSDRMQILNDSINDLKKKQKIAQKEFESLEDIGHYQARFEEIKDLGNALQKEDAEFLQAYQDGNAKKMQALAPGFEPVLTDLGHEVWEKRSPFGQFNKEFDKGAATYDKFLKVGKSTQDLVNSLTPEPDDREFGDRGGKAVKDLNDLRTNGAIASLKERMNKSVSGTIKDFVENNIKPLLGDPEKRSVHAKNMDEHIKKIMEKGTAAERREARKTGFLGQTANTELAQKEADKNKAESEEEKAWFQESTELWRMKKSQERIV
ncbi:MAG: hypothetical protein H7A33_08550 [Deltaproteobacteria bacterium]|nr:hypothetical protein [Deltaproteobacteria bacterium]